MSLSQCFDTTDPITLDEIDESDLVVIDIDRARNKGHCFSVDSIADYIKSKIENGSKIIKNPVNPKYILTDEDKNKIYKQMRNKNPSWDLPVYNKKYEKKSLFFSRPEEASLSSLEQPTRVGFGVQIAPAATLPNRIREANLSIRPTEQDDIELAEALSRITTESRNIQSSISRQGENQNSSPISPFSSISSISNSSSRNQRPAVTSLSGFSNSENFSNSGNSRGRQNFKDSPTSNLAKQLAKEREDSFSNPRNHFSISNQGENSIESKPIVEFDTEDGKVSWKEVYINPALKQPGRRNRDLEKYKSKRNRKSTSTQQRQNSRNIPVSNQGENTITTDICKINSQNPVSTPSSNILISEIKKSENINPVIIQPVAFLRFIKGQNGFQARNQGEKVIPIQEQFNILSSEVSKRWSLKQIITAAIVFIVIIAVCFWIRKRMNAKRSFKR